MNISRKTLLTALAAGSIGTMAFLAQGAKAQTNYDITAQCSQVRQSTYNSVKASIEAAMSGCPNTAPSSYAACTAAVQSLAEQQATAAAASAEQQCLYNAYRR